VRGEGVSLHPNGSLRKIGVRGVADSFSVPSDDEDASGGSEASEPSSRERGYSE